MLHCPAAVTQRWLFPDSTLGWHHVKSLWLTFFPLFGKQHGSGEYPMGLFPLIDPAAALTSLQGVCLHAVMAAGPGLLRVEKKYVSCLIQPLRITVLMLTSQIQPIFPLFRGKKE